MADAAHTRDRDGSSTPSPPPRLEALGGRLTTPVARKTDSIASQFQREILGAKPQLRFDPIAVGGSGTVV